MTPEEEFNLYDSQKNWTAIFQKIHSDAQKKHKYSLEAARRPEYKSRNRYGDVSPYDDSRIRLQRNGIDYINASLVKSPSANRAYILTQGPLPNTASHFWLMVWEQNSQAILMLNRIIEKGQVKCYQYYPTGDRNEDEDERVFEDVGLKVTYLSEHKDNYHYTVRVYQLEDLTSHSTKQVIQFHFTAWLDFAVPDSAAFLDFLFAVRSSGALDDPFSPPVIHCSAGIGRSGTFCLIDTCLVLIEKQGKMDGINVIDILMEMRKYRMGLIQTPQQLRFSFQAIIEGAKQVLPISSSPESDSAVDVTEEMNSNSNRKSFSISSDLDQDSDSSPSGTPPPIPPRLGPAAPRPVLPYSSLHNGNDVGTIPNGTVTQDSTQDSTQVAPQDSEQKQTTPEQEIRRRKREERIRQTAEQIARMKERQRESELYRSREQKLKPYLIGLLAAVVIGGYVLYRCYWT